MERDTGHGADRRRARRFSLELPLQFESGAGTTCNVSAAGVLFTTPKPPQPGERMRCSLRMADGRELLFEARVVRVEDLGDAYRVAAQFDALQSGLTGPH